MRHNPEKKGGASGLTGHVADATARVAGLLAEAAGLATTTTVAGVEATTTATIGGAALGAVAGNVADLAALEIRISDRVLTAKQRGSLPCSTQHRPGRRRTGRHRHHQRHRRR